MDRLKKVKRSFFKTIDSVAEAGIVTEGLPFNKLSVEKRAWKLKNTLEGQIKSAYREGEIIEYKLLAELFYKDLRMAWERAAEKILFDDVVKRFGRNASTQIAKGCKILSRERKDC